MPLTNRKITFTNFLFFYLSLIAIFSSISYYIFIDNFQELESNKNHKDINLLLSSMSSKMKHIETITNDYSYWDETFDFIEEKNNSYIKGNFENNINLLKELDLDFMIFVNLKSQVIFSKYRKDRFLAQNLEFSEKVIKIGLNNREFNSLFRVDKKIFYLRKSKIVKSGDKGNFNGFIYSGKVIDENSFLDNKYAFKSKKLEYTEKIKNAKKIEIGYLHNLRIDRKLEDDCFVNKIEFYDIFNNYIATLELKNTRQIVNSGKKTILYYNIAIAVSLLIIFLILWRTQNSLFRNNSKLELKISSNEKKLNEYINIVNKYVTTSSTDLNGNITDVSEAFCRISGYERSELIGKSHNIIKHTDMDPAIYAELWETIISGKKWVGEIKNKKKNGEAYWVLAHIDPVYSSRGKIIGYTSIRQDITDKKRVEKLSVTDKLTQLYNRVKLEEIFTIEIAKYRRYNSTFSMIILDIDHFKEVNDTYGHNVGDVFLQEVASILKSSVRIEDIVGRWGGEEFIILVNNSSSDGILSIAEKIRKNIESYTFKTVGKKTASFGIATVNETDDQETMIARADKSLYHAKETGRNKVCML